MTEQEDHTVSVRAEQAVLGALLAENHSLDRIAALDASHFYRHDHRLIFDELRRQITAGRNADAVTVFERLKDQVEDCLKYCANMRQSALSGANIRLHAAIVIDRAKKRSLVALGMELQAVAASHEAADQCIDQFAVRLEELGRAQTEQDPELLCDMMAGYAQSIEDRHAGRIKPVGTGFRDLDNLMDGGADRGTLVVAAGRPSMGKTAFGLNIARNVATEGVALFLSMEMPRNQVNDRNIAAIGKIPLWWLKKPGDSQDPASHDARNWAAMAEAFGATKSMRLFIDDQTSLNLLAIRAKARRVKRQAGALDVLVIDQLSFITGGKGDRFELTGEYTRGLVALAKELDIVVVLLCQLNRKCEDRPNKRPILSDLAQSGSIEQDAAYVIFLYRDEVYTPDSPDKGIAEAIIAKQRQGRVGVARLGYVGEQTRFEDLDRQYLSHPAVPKHAPVGGFQ